VEAFQVTFQGLQSVSWWRSEIIEFVRIVEYIHFAKRSTTNNALRETSGARRISAMIEVCGGGVTKLANSH